LIYSTFLISFSLFYSSPFHQNLVFNSSGFSPEWKIVLRLYRNNTETPGHSNENLKMIFMLKILLILIILFLPATTLANCEDIRINSDSLTFDRNKNTVNFTNNVLVWFEDMVLKTSAIEVIYQNNDKSQNRIDKIIIPNSVIATRIYQQQTIIADSAEYNAKSAELILNGRVKLQYQDNILKTKKLVYHTNFKKVTNIDESH